MVNTSTLSTLAFKIEANRRFKIVALLMLS